VKSEHVKYNAEAVKFPLFYS